MAQPAHDANGATSSWAFLTALCLSSSLSVLGSLALTPFLADIAPALDTSVALLGQALTAAGLVGAVCGLAAGPAAEHIGYRRLLLIGLAAMAAADIGVALAPSFPLLVAAQLGYGLSGATVSPMVYALAGRRFHGERRRWAISRVYAASSAGLVVGFPTIATIGGATSWRWAFVALAALAVGCWTLAFVILPGETPAPEGAFRLRALPGAYAPLLRHPPTALLLGAQLLRGICWSGALAYLGAFIVDALDGSVQLAGFAWVVLGPGFMLGSLLVGGPLRRHEQRLTFLAAITIMGALLAVVFASQTGMVASFAVLFIAATAGGVAEVTALTLLANETPAPQGATMTLHSSTLRCGSAGGALIGGALLALGGYGALGVGLACVAAGGALLMWLSRLRVAAVTRAQAVAK